MHSCSSCNQTKQTTATTCLMDFRTMFMGFQNCSIHGISSIDHGQTISSRQHGIGKQHHVTLNNHHQTRQTKCKGFSEHVYEILNCSRVLVSNFMVHQPIEIKQSWQPTTTFRMLMQHISIATNTHRHENSGQGRFGMNNSTHKKLDQHLQQQSMLTKSFIQPQHNKPTSSIQAEFWQIYDSYTTVGH